MALKASTQAALLTVYCLASASKNLQSGKAASHSLVAESIEVLPAIIAALKPSVSAMNTVLTELMTDIVPLRPQ
mgnify:CR=1 FL=1